MKKIYTYNGNVVRKSTSEKNNYRYGIVGTCEDGSFGSSSCSSNYDRLYKELVENKSYYTTERVEKALNEYEHPETSNMWGYWQHENASWTKEEVINALKRNYEMYRRRHYFWENAKVVELEVTVK